MAVPNPLCETIQLRNDDRVHIFGEYWRPIRSDRIGHWLSQVGTTENIIFVTHGDFNIERMCVDFTHEENWFRPSSVERRIDDRGFCLRNLPIDDQNDILCKIRWIKGYYELLRNNEISRNGRGYNEAVEKLSARFGQSRNAINWSVDDHAVRKQNRGSRANYLIPPTAISLKRYVKQLEDSDYDIIALRDGRCRSGNRKPRFGPETIYLLEQYARKFASYKKPTRQVLYSKFKAVFERLNRQFLSEGRLVDDLPSYSRFCIEVAKLQPFEVDVARLGRERAARKWRIMGIGPDVEWALQRVEMDFYEVDLQVILSEKAIWNNLARHLKDKITRSRWYLCVALDVASRCVLGMRLATNENAVTAAETLRMVFYDKSHIGRAAGALTPWDQHGMPECLCTDLGTAFVSAYFHARAESVLADVFHPPAAQPQLRPFIERFFKTVKDGLLSRFEGFTAGSAQALGDYPAQLRAVLTIDNFAELLVRWCVDVYHNIQHDGLGRETPRDAWLRLTRLMMPRPGPSARRMRDSFGMDVFRRTGRRGIWIAGLSFNSEHLQSWCRANGDASVQVRIDPENIGSISVRPDPRSVEWLEVPCCTKFMRGRKLVNWLQAASELRRRYGEVAALRLPIVLEAIELIEQAHSRAVSIADIGPGQPTEKELIAVERELGMGFQIPSYDESTEELEPSDGETRSYGKTSTLPTTFGATLGRSFATDNGPRSSTDAHGNGSPQSNEIDTGSDTRRTSILDPNSAREPNPPDPPPPGSKGTISPVAPVSGSETEDKGKQLQRQNPWRTKS